MITCGLKLTHDSSIALIENNNLKFCIELEKVNNNNRFKIIDDLTIIEEVLLENGYQLEDIDQFVIDGWVGEEGATINAKNLHNAVRLSVAPYQETLTKNVSHRYTHNSLPIGHKKFKYVSYSHVAGHILSSYCTSPFAANNEDSYVLVWDGGMFPKLYFISGTTLEISYIDVLFHLGVNIYSIFSQHFGPFKINENVIKDELSIAGKVMAFTAFGKRELDIIHDFEYIYQSSICQELNNIPNYPYLFTARFKESRSSNIFFDEDILTSFHSFLQEMLINSLSRVIGLHKRRTKNLCYVGGAALNIKWNSALRNTKLFDNIWICPFPNDSGSAIGTACCELKKLRSNNIHINWNVYSGPTLTKNEPYLGWNKKACKIEELAHLLYETNEPVVFLQGKAELGPRALGNRSIISSAASPYIKDILNQVKYRESYRPVAPICLEEEADKIFDPGGSDPFMLFEHKVKKEWQMKIPSICHIDETARLQTINKDQNKEIYLLLVNYYRLSSIPVLCNTSANFKGSGFFPDIYSATRWGKVNYVWADGVLYEKIMKNIFPVSAKIPPSLKNLPIIDMETAAL